MKSLSQLIAVFTFLAAAIGLIIAAVYFIDRKCGLFCDEDDDEPDYGGQEYYSEDLSFDPQSVEEEQEEPAAEETAEKQEQE